ncbi:hypothetical protein GCM10011356_03230 [Kangiella profundi]|nr:hypothetical protein GCM10011356_03230 [Kangiella profundi]
MDPVSSAATACVDAIPSDTATANAEIKGIDFLNILRLLLYEKYKVPFEYTPTKELLTFLKNYEIDRFYL